MPAINNGISELYPGTSYITVLLFVIIGYLRYACRPRAAQGVEKGNSFYV